MSVGFVGLGNMGQGMVDNLLAKGADLTVFTRTQSKIEAMIDRGAKGASSVVDLTNNVDVVLMCLPDVKTSRDLLLGSDGVIANSRSGQVIVDHSTVDIATSRACAQAAEAKGVHFLDAPISGGPGGAEAGTLAIMVGGDESAFETAHEYFVKMGANVKLMGPSGAGTAMKLINQLAGSGKHSGSGRSVRSGQFGWCRHTDCSRPSGSKPWGGSTMVDRSAPITASRDFADSAAPVRNLDKDMGIIKQLAADEGLSLELALKSYAMFHTMLEQGNREHDIAAVLEIIEERSI